MYALRRYNIILFRYGRWIIVAVAAYSHPSADVAAGAQRSAASSVVPIWLKRTRLSQ